MDHVQEHLEVSDRRACRVLKQPRSTQRYMLRVAEDEEHLTARVIALASEYGRYSYRRMTGLIRNRG